jgi:hypothetical protein
VPAALCLRNWPRGALANDKNPAAAPAGREALGRSRGGLSTKIHLAADRRCRPLTRITTPGQHGDCPRFIALMDQLAIRRRGTGRPRTRPGTALGDKAYSSAANRAYLRKRGSRRSSRSRKTRRITAATAAATAAARPPSTGNSTRTATKYRDRTLAIGG